MARVQIAVRLSLPEGKEGREALGRRMTEFNSTLVGMAIDRSGLARSAKLELLGEICAGGCAPWSGPSAEQEESAPDLGQI